MSAEMGEAGGGAAYNGLTMPDYVFVNCIATYMFSIFNHSVEPAFRDDILLFLTSMKIRRFTLDTEKIQKRHGNLGRYYQAFNFFHSDTYHKSQKWHLLVSDFLSKHFSMKLNITFGDDVAPDLVSFIGNALREKGHLFLLIDDYYSPDSKKHYLKHHDTHWINILEMDHESITAQDSNYPRLIKIPFHLLEQAYFSPFNRQETAFMENCSSSERLDNVTLFEACDPDGDFIGEFPELIASVCEGELPLAYLDGLCNSMLTKCIPMYYMFRHLAAKGCRNKNMSAILQEKAGEVINHFLRMSLMNTLMATSADGLKRYSGSVAKTLVTLHGSSKEFRALFHTAKRSNS